MDQTTTETALDTEDNARAVRELRRDLAAALDEKAAVVRDRSRLLSALHAILVTLDAPSTPTDRIADAALDAVGAAKAEMDRLREQERDAVEKNGTLRVQAAAMRSTLELIVRAEEALPPSDESYRMGLVVACRAALDGTAGRALLDELARLQQQVADLVEDKRGLDRCLFDATATIAGLRADLATAREQRDAATRTAARWERLARARGGRSVDGKACR